MGTAPIAKERRADSGRAGSGRVLSVDALRGVTIAFMILVNDPGDWSHVYRQLDHAEWNGWTLTDLVFPTFLFLVGASIVFSLEGRLRRGQSAASYVRHVGLRAGKILLLDLFIAGFPYFHWHELRIYGVLTRIAVCYLIGALILLATRSKRVLAAVTATLLAGYWALLRFVPVPGFGVPERDVPLLDMTGNLTSWIDRGVNAFLQRTLHTGVLYRGTRDPEGLLSTLPAIATVLIGAMAALWLRENWDRPIHARNGLMSAGSACFAAGILWGHWFPINKNMWTSSYVLMAAGWALVGLGLFFWLIDIERLHERSTVGRWLAWPAFVFGSNAIVAYAVSELLVEVMFDLKFHDGGRPTNLLAYIYDHVFARGHSTDLTSLAFAVCFVAVCLVPNWILFRKKIFVRV